jgi:hypothetical protein
LHALRNGLLAASGAKLPPIECARAALAAVAALPQSELPARPLAPDDGMPVTAVTPMLEVAALGPVAGPDAKAGPGETSDVVLTRNLTAIEWQAGAPPIAARAIATSAISQRDAALQSTARIEPPKMTPEAFCDHLRSLIGALRTLQASGERRAA